jgi:hypothetical protein
MTGNGTSENLLAILGKSFSPEGRRGADPGEGTGTGVDADGAEGRGSGSEPGLGAGQDHDQGVKTGELPAEIKTAIDKLELLKGRLEEELGSQRSNMTPPQEGTASGASSAEDSETPANKPPSLEVQLAIVDSLLIMFETPATRDGKIDRAVRMDKSSKALAGLNEEELTAAIDFMENICKDDEFSAAVYQYMRRHFCVSNEEDISEFNAEDTRDKKPYKDWDSVNLYGKIVCVDLTCTMCTEVIKTQEKCGVCEKLICRSCTWKEFFSTSVPKQYPYNLEEEWQDPYIPLVIKTVSYFRVRNADYIDVAKKTQIENDFWAEMDALEDHILFRCPFCKSSLYLHDNTYKRIERLVRGFISMYRLVSSNGDKLADDDRSKVRPLGESFSTSVKALKALHTEHSKTLITEKGNINYEIAHDNLRREYQKLCDEFDEHHDVVSSIEDRMMKRDLSTPMKTTDLESVDTTVWKTRFPAFHDDENVIDFLKNPVSDWSDGTYDPPKTFWDVLSENVEAYMSDPHTFSFMNVYRIPPTPFFEYETSSEVSEDENSSEFSEDATSNGSSVAEDLYESRDGVATPVERTFDSRGIAVSGTKLVNKVLGVRDGENTEVVHDAEFKGLAGKARDLWRREKGVLSSAKRKLARGLMWDILLNRAALIAWAAYYGERLAVYMNGTQTTMSSLLKSPRIVAFAVLLASKTEVEFFVDVDIERDEARNVAKLGNRRILPKYKHLRGAGGDAVPVVAGPRRSTEALTEYVLKKVLLGKFEELSRDPARLFRDLTSGIFDLTKTGTVDRFVAGFTPEVRNMWQIDAILDVAILLGVVQTTAGETDRDLLRRLLRAFRFSTESYMDTCRNFGEIAPTALVSPPDCKRIIDASDSVVKGFEYRANSEANISNSLAFELALAIVWMRANCSGRNASFRQLKRELDSPPQTPPTATDSGADSENTVAQDEFLAACGHLRDYFGSPGQGEEEEAGRPDPRPRREVSSDGSRQTNASVNPVTSLVQRLSRAAGTVRQPAARGTFVIPTGRQVFPMQTNNIAFPTSDNPATGRRAWRGGAPASGARRLPFLSGGEGAEKGGASGVSAAAAIFLSLAVVAASALAGALSSGA